MNIENSRFPMTKLVVVFNWHFFLIAALACAVGILGIIYLDVSWIRIVLGLGVAAGIYFMIVSIIASYFVYDHSDLYKLSWWPDRVMPDGASDAVLVHAGFDPASRKLAKKYSDMNLRILDFFDDDTTTETSIRTARKLFPPLEGETQIKIDAWPLDDGSQDVVFAISAAHEIRNNDERATFFHEANRVLRKGGRLVVVEQLRDVRNFLAFGGAVLHFLSHATWIQSFSAGGFGKPDEFWISPWMKAFVLTSD